MLQKVDLRIESNGLTELLWTKKVIHFLLNFPFKLCNEVNITFKACLNVLIRLFDLKLSCSGLPVKFWNIKFAAFDSFDYRFKFQLFWTRVEVQSSKFYTQGLRIGSDTVVHVYSTIYFGVSKFQAFSLNIHFSLDILLFYYFMGMKTLKNWV